MTVHNFVGYVSKHGAAVKNVFYSGRMPNIKYNFFTAI